MIFHDFPMIFGAQPKFWGISQSHRDPEKMTRPSKKQFHGMGWMVKLNGMEMNIELDQQQCGDNQNMIGHI